MNKISRLFSKTELKRLIRNHTVQNAGLALVIKAVGTAASLLVSVLLARKLGASTVGVYGLASSVIQLALIAAKFGLDTTLIKYISIYYSKNLGRDIRKTLLYSAVLSLGISVVCVFIVWLAMPLIVNNIFHNPDLEPILSVMIFSTFPLALVQILAGAFKGLQLTKTGLFFESTSLPLCLASLLAGFFFIISPEMGSLQLGALYLLASTISCLLATAIAIFKTAKITDASSKRNSYKRVLDTARPLLLVNSTNYLLGCADTIMLGIWCSTDQVGIYGVATKVTTLFSMLTAIINAMLGPKFAVMYYDGKIDELRQQLAKASRVMRLMAVAIVTLLSCFAYPILSIWGPEFAAAWPIFLISLFGQFFVLAKGPVASLLMMCGYEKIHRNNTLLCAILNIILNAIMIPLWGIYGAAIATAISLALKNILTALAGRKLFSK